MVNSIILFHNKEKMEQFFPLFEKLKDEDGCRLAKSYFRIPSSRRVKEVHDEISRELNMILSNIHYESPEKIVIFAFNL